MDRGMAFSLAAAGLILAACSGIGWRNHIRETTLRQEWQEWSERARVAGISVEAKNGRVTKAARRDGSEESPTDFARRFIALVKASGDGEVDEGVANRMLDRLELLDPGVARIILNEVEKDPDLKAETRAELHAIVIISLGVSYPEESLAMLGKTGNLDPGGIIDEDFITSLLKRRATTDPQAALAWVRENASKNPDLVGEDAKAGVIAGTAASAPPLAFQWIRELELDDADEAVGKIMRAGRNDEERSAIVNALREEIARTKDDEVKEELLTAAYPQIAQGVLDRGFLNSKTWLDGLKLAPEEMERFSEGALACLGSGDCPPDEVPRWLEWIAESDPTEATDGNLDRMAGVWAQQHPKLAGKWLESAPEGPLKDRVSKGFTEEKAPEENEDTPPAPVH